MDTNTKADLIALARAAVEAREAQTAAVRAGQHHGPMSSERAHYDAELAAAHVAEAEAVEALHLAIGAELYDDLDAGRITSLARIADGLIAGRRRFGIIDPVLDLRDGEYRFLATEALRVEFGIVLSD